MLYVEHELEEELLSTDDVKLRLKVERALSLMPNEFH